MAALRPTAARLATFIGRPPPAHALKALAHVHGPGCDHGHDHGHAHGVVHTYDHHPGHPAPSSAPSAAAAPADPQLQLGPFPPSPALLADHIALAGAGAQILAAVKEKGWAWAPVPANGWVVRGFIEAAGQAGREQAVVSAYSAAGVMEEIAAVDGEGGEAWADWSALYSSSSLEFTEAETFAAFPTPADTLTPAGLAYLQNFAETVNIARGVGGVRLFSQAQDAATKGQDFLKSEQGQKLAGQYGDQIKSATGIDINKFTGSAQAGAGNALNGAQQAGGNAVNTAQQTGTNALNGAQQAGGNALNSAQGGLSGLQNQAQSAYEGFGGNDSTTTGGFGRNAGGSAFSRANQLGADANNNGGDTHYGNDDDDQSDGYKTGTSTPGYRQEGDEDGKAAEARIRQGFGFTSLQKNNDDEPNI
ncbi:hypothetical protein Q8F55_003109 [Vanrija albida]|uniref:Uncharacterized protein n=1 Tax=Vanrija albida TaxID=181172 RepID=A0ABR3QBM2_9TREE